MIFAVILFTGYWDNVGKIWIFQFCGQGGWDYEFEKIKQRDGTPGTTICSLIFNICQVRDNKPFCLDTFSLCCPETLKREVKISNNIVVLKQ